MWPVILRELRAGSRRWTTYWLRLMAATAVVFAVLFWFADEHPSARAGSEMFAHIHRIVLAAIWVLVPLMTCDCLSQEKREGTLGLLFLTSLSAREIVLAKAAAQIFRALTLWLATVPIIGIPLLLGGLVWKEVVLSCSFAFVSICGALAVGLFASALGRRINSAVAWTATLAPVICFLIAPAIVLFLTTCALVSHRMTIGEALPDEIGESFAVAAGVFWNIDNLWQTIFTGTKAAGAVLVGALLIVPLAFLSLIGFCTGVIAPIVRLNWQDKPKTKRRTDVEKFFCAPVFMTGLFRRWMRHSLESNPIGWLEKRSWAGRITSWIWLAVMISFASLLAYTAASSDDLEGYTFLMWALLATIAYVAAGSFRRERETGALELILVTPLSERHIIFGRLRGLWSQFLPTFLIWLFVVFYLSKELKEWEVTNLLRFTILYFIVPIVGLYFSLRSRFVLVSWLATLGVCLAVPQLIWWLSYIALSSLGSIARVDENAFSISVQRLSLSAVQLALAAFLLWRLRVNLMRRTFSFR